MTYRLIKDDESGDVKRLENGSGDVIWTREGAWSPTNEDYLSAIIDDADFTKTQMDALLALFHAPTEVFE